MADSSPHPLMHYLRRLCGPVAAASEVDDGQLLHRFLSGHDEAAFTTIVQRYGAMVWGLCVRRLGETPEAEDAFQATFLVLVRKAASLRRPEQLGPWLYGVAYRTALKLRGRRARQAMKEMPLHEPAVQEESSELHWRELRPILDEEVNRLPEKYRQPVLLCYLQGYSSEEAAQRLGCPKGTIFSRLSRARDLLRWRLVRRGVEVSAGALAAVLVDNAFLRAAPPAALSETTVRLSLLLVAGTTSSALSGSVAVLVEGVLRSMFLSKIKFALIVVLILGLVGSGLGFLAHHSKAQQPVPVPAAGEDKAKAKESEAKPKPKADKPAKDPKDRAALLKARVVAAEKVYQAVFEGLSRTRRVGNNLIQITQNPEEAYLWSVRWLQAERALKPKPEDQIAALQEHLQRMTKLKEVIEQLSRDLMFGFNNDKAEWYQLEAELWLQEAKAAK
jgi:RNA polymerase sigma factor (sigma-70 family)